MALLGLFAVASLTACTRTSDSGASGQGTAVRDDVKGVVKATEKTAKDIGQATVELGDKARKGLDEAGGDGQDAWLTTKVKSELTRVGLDPLHVHVDTAGKVVTLSGTVDSPADEHKAVIAARGVKDVVAVQDHLSVNSPRR